MVSEISRYHECIFSYKGKQLYYILFSANGCGTVRVDIILQDHADLSPDCETHYKHTLCFHVRIISAATWQELVFVSSFIYFIYLFFNVILFVDRS
jgi:hypothetical protein